MRNVYWLKKADLTMMTASVAKGERRDEGQAIAEIGRTECFIPNLHLVLFSISSRPSDGPNPLPPLPIYCQMNQEFTLSFFTSHLPFLPLQCAFQSHYIFIKYHIHCLFVVPTHPIVAKLYLLFNKKDPIFYFSLQVISRMLGPRFCFPFFHWPITFGERTIMGRSADSAAEGKSNGKLKITEVLYLYESLSECLRWKFFFSSGPNYSLFNSKLQVWDSEPARLGHKPQLYKFSAV